MALRDTYTRGYNGAPSGLPALAFGSILFWKGFAMTRKEAERQEAIVELRAKIQPGATIRTILRHVSRSGMTRHISVVMPDCGEISWLVGRALDYRRHNDGGLVVGNCGMDMGFAIVYSLSHALFPDGFDCIGEGCPASDHSNGDRDRTPHKHSDGGYALRQQWL